MTIRYWYQYYAEHYEQEFTVEPDHVAVDEKQVQFRENESHGCMRRLMPIRKSCVKHDFRSITDRFGSQCLRELKEKYCVRLAVFLVNGIGYLAALARTDLASHLDYSDRNIVKRSSKTTLFVRAVLRNLERVRSALGTCGLPTPTTTSIEAIRHWITRRGLKPSNRRVQSRNVLISITTYKSCLDRGRTAK